MLDQLNGETRLFPIIGDPVKFVQIIPKLTRAFEARGHNGICVPMQVPDGQLDIALDGLTGTLNVDGVLVTMPHKFGAFQRCATSSETAKRLGGVSVMRRNADGSWHGDMKDGEAFVKAQVDAGAQLRGAKVLLVGAGAAGSAIGVAMLAAGVRELLVHDASHDRVAQLLTILSELGQASVSIGSSDPSGCDVICNATPMGMAKGDPLPVQTERFTSSMFVGDVVAGHGETPFLRAAASAGCKTANGDQMVAAVEDVMVDFMLHSER